MVKLSICIATYNRANFIGETLDSIMPQLTNEVELVVVDGASPDNTEEVISHYAKENPNVRYIREPIKGGVDQDFCKTVEAACGGYCWMFMDDDIMKPGAIQAVLDQIEQGYDLILVNSELRNQDLSEIIEERRLHIPSDRVYLPHQFDQFFMDNAAYMSFMGCVVIKRTIWKEREKERYYGTEFIHVGIIFQKPLSNPILVIASPYISIRLGNAQWSSRTFEVWFFKWPTIIWSLDSFSETIKARVSSREPWRKLTSLLFCRAEGNFGPEEYCRFIGPRMPSFFERSIIRTIVYTPGVLLNFLAHIFYLLTSPHTKGIFFRLKQSRYYFFNFLIVGCAEKC